MNFWFPGLMFRSILEHWNFCLEGGHVIEANFPHSVHLLYFFGDFFYFVKASAYCFFAVACALLWASFDEAVSL